LLLSARQRRGVPQQAGHVSLRPRIQRNRCCVAPVTSGANLPSPLPPYTLHAQGRERGSPHRGWPLLCRTPHKQVTSVCMKVEWLSSASIAVLWSASDDWTVPHLIAPTELAGSILHSLPSAVFIASSDAKDVRADRTRHEYAPGFLIKTPTGQPLLTKKLRVERH
jgi:hypothetical protein